MGGGAEESGVEEIEEAPEFEEVVFDGCAGGGDADVGLEGLGVLGSLGGVVLDGLCLVDDTVSGMMLLICDNVIFDDED